MKHILLMFFSEARLHHDGMMMDGVRDKESVVQSIADSLKVQGEQLDCLCCFSTKKLPEEIGYGDEVSCAYILNHEALIPARMQSLAGHFIGIDYDERSQLEKRIHQVLKMADRIDAFIEEQSWQPEEVALHVDITGDVRYASMMMLSVIQFLKCRGIRKVDVLYADGNEQPVENITEIYRMFDLFSRADTFVNFGSIREIMAYLEGSVQTRETKILLQTVRDFNHAVRICHTGKITILAKKLQEALQNFEMSGAISFQEKIFLRILKVFKAEYGGLLKEDFTNLDIIRWCVEKDYLQQALTLCTEWIPSEIVDRHIFYPLKNSIPKECTRKKMPYQTWQQYFLNDFTVARTKKDSEAYLNRLFPRLEKKKRVTRLRTIIADFEASGDMASVLRRYPKDAGYFKALLEELQVGPQVLADLNKERLTRQELKKKFPKIYAVLHRMYHHVKNTPMFDQTMDEFFKTRTIGPMYNVLKTAPYQFFQTLLPLPDEFLEQTPPSVGDIPGIYVSQIAWNNRQVYYLRMMSYDYVGYKRPAKAVLEILYDYFQIRTERNHINHAYEEDSLSTQAIKDLVLDLLRRMEDIDKLKS